MKLTLRKILVGALALMGFSGCGSRTVVEYGCPQASLNINVKVKALDQEGNPVGKTRLILKGLEDNRELCYVETGDDGTASVSRQFFADMRPTSGANVVYYSDENPDHSGKFKDDSVIVKSEKIKAGDGNWDLGTYEMNINLKLEKK